MQDNSWGVFQSPTLKAPEVQSKVNMVGAQVAKLMLG
ncbi:hypothetical protein [Sporisorium scitamineum]|uniref:Uncharacterized protein n=1 Tax=Sporisorium scitamineum TaxID=49012 RepID=A0A0F7S0U4_9BASI|nr:hypothetical protein [Sporisorium scitamineum]